MVKLYSEIMFPPRPQRLWLSIAWPFLLFVIAGSVALVLWMQTASRRQENAVFTALARANANFLGEAHLPETPQMMDDLSRLLNMQAFLRIDGALMPASENPSLRAADSALLALAPAQG